MKIFRHLIFLIALGITFTKSDDEFCDQVSEGNFFKDGAFYGLGDLQFVSGEIREVYVTFDQNTVEYFGIDFMTSWNKI